MEPKWLEWSKQLQAISQAGLSYSKDVYDIERFEAIRKISVEIMAMHTEVDSTIIKDLFANETGYATPKVDIRAAVFKNNRILLVKEKTDGKWALPGGWGDIGLSPSEVAVKEVKEESGFDVKATKLMAVFDKKFHGHPPSPSHVYKILINCKIIGGNAEVGIETSEVQFFAEDALPPLSLPRNTEAQIQIAFKHHYNANEPVYFD
ncbi:MULTISPECIES: NUDIX hydrolase [unclassified Niallia]|uniref:NUDIX hydrolase n=1 Tax=unclassified Niallia TaxID=2837522 RepID=UPI001EDBDD59|nr:MULTISPECIES: NUDIX hydrolase [unclassified Niallia]MCM3032404.1 NUDIX hydrolase [Niallia sp. MER 6]UPO90200.1 NUDIX hydrolase [Niallia sp. Man26]